MKHIGFIMDGNRRWAKKLSNIVAIGHEKGGDNIEPILQLCLDAGIDVVSMWALSKENMNERSPEEIGVIFDLFRKKVPKLIEKLIKENIRFDVVGDLWSVPTDVRSILLDAIDQTSQGQKMTFVLAIAYSGQDEIIRGIQNFIASGAEVSSLDATNFLDFLDTGRFPPPDLIVRTGGNIRHSGYFLYQSAYSEYYFTETLWPDFGKKDFDAALEWYKTSKRNFGK